MPEQWVVNTFPLIVLGKVGQLSMYVRMFTASFRPLWAKTGGKVGAKDDTDFIFACMGALIILIAVVTGRKTHAYGMPGFVE
jgi:hypothetical protein